MRNCIFILFIYLSISPFGQLTAQDYTIHVQQFGIEEGLAHRNVQAIFKDTSGFLWIASQNELQRFDGYEFKSFQLPKQLGIISHIGQGDNGQLFLMNMIERQFLFMNPTSGNATTLAEKWGSDLATAVDSLMRIGQYFYLQEDHFYTITSRGITSINWQTGKQKLLIPKESWIGKDIIKIQLIDSQNNIWIETEDEIIVMSPQQKIVNSFTLHSSIKGNGGYELLNNWKNETWSITKIGRGGKEPYRLFKFKENGNQEFIFEAPLGFKIHQFIEGQIWCNNDSSWQVYNISGDLLFELNAADYDEKLFKGTLFSIITKDESGKFYLPTEFGFNIIDVHKNPFTQYFSTNEKEPLPIKNSARSIYAKNDSIIVVFEFGGMVLFKKKEPKNYKIIAPHLLHPITKQVGAFSGRIVFRDAAQHFWTDMGRYMYRWSSDFSTPEAISFSGEAPTASEPIWAAFEDENNCVWLGYTKALTQLVKNAPKKQRKSNFFSFFWGK